MRASHPSSTVAALVAAIAVVIAACGGPASPTRSPGPTLAPGATPTATPLGGGGGGGTTPGPNASEGTGGGPGTSEEPSFEEITPLLGSPDLLGVRLLAGDMTWDGTVDTSGMGWSDTWNVQVDLVLRRSDQHGGLVFAKGSTFSLDWETARPIDDVALCQENRAHWTGDIGTPSGEGWDALSEADPEGIGIVHEDLHSLVLDISLAGIHSGEWCDFPGVILRCPYEIAPGNQALWQQTIDDPARLDYSCTSVSPASAGQVHKVNVRGLLQEAEDVP